MPKIIHTVRDRVIREARRILNAPGYTAFTMREIAAACKIATGTVYNYFPSKEYLVGCVVLEDWQAAYGEMTGITQRADTLELAMEEIYTLMCSFVEAHQYLTTFDIREAKDGYDFASRHIMMRQQIEALLTMLRNRFDTGTDEATIIFLAECVLSFSTKKYSYQQISAAFNKLLDQRKEDRS